MAAGRAKTDAPAPAMAADATAPTPAPFWKTKTLKQMTDAEWESLCDGCGKCCLVKLEDEETQELYFTSLHCKLLNPGTCQCSDYANRKKYVPECVKLTPDSIPTLDWLPNTCAYKLVHEGQDLKDWHHLVCGDRDEVHRRGISAKGKVRSEVGVDDEDALDYLIDWAHGPAGKAKRRRKRL
jgi:uncharacterized cysteine cluster protein YcgN (CxxCxxCC family)